MLGSPGVHLLRLNASARATFVYARYFRVAKRDVTWHDGYIPNSNGCVDAHQHGALERRGIDTANVNLKALNLLNSANIAHGAVHDQTVMALGVNCGGKIVTGEGSVANFAEQIDYQQISGLQDVNNPRVLASHAGLLFSVCLNY